MELKAILMTTPETETRMEPMELKTDTLLLRQHDNALHIRLNRPEQENSISFQLLLELNAALDLAESDPAVTVVVIEGNGQAFSVGMDFTEIETMQQSDPAGLSQWAESYMTTLKRFRESARVIISVAEGKVMAGGVGLLAASDIAIAAPAATIRLPEALWGLLPANVLPYLVFRTGLQHAYRLTLSCDGISAAEAHRIGLVDHVAEQPDTIIKHYMVTSRRLSANTVRHIKTYFDTLRHMPQDMEEYAARTLTGLLQDKRVKTNLHEFIYHHHFPWEEEHYE